MTGSGCADRRVDGVDDPGRPGPAAARRGGRGLSGYGGKTRRYNADKTTPSSTVHHGSPDGARERAIYTGGTRGRFSYDTHPAHTQRSSEPANRALPPGRPPRHARSIASLPPHSHRNTHTRTPARTVSSHELPNGCTTLPDQRAHFTPLQHHPLAVVATRPRHTHSTNHTRRAPHHVRYTHAHAHAHAEAHTHVCRSTRSEDDAPSPIALPAHTHRHQNSYSVRTRSRQLPGHPGTCHRHRKYMRYVRACGMMNTTTHGCSYEWTCSSVPF